MRPFPGDDVFLGGRARAAPDDELPTAFNTPAGPQMTFFIGDESAVDSALQQSSSSSATTATATASTAITTATSAFLRSKEARKPPAPHNNGGPLLSDNADPASLSSTLASSSSSYHYEHGRDGKEIRDSIRDLRDSQSQSQSHLLSLESSSVVEVELPGHDHDDHEDRGDDMMSVSMPDMPANNSNNSNNRPGHNHNNHHTLSQPMTPIFLGASGPASALSSVSSRRNSLSASSADLGSHSQALSVDDGETDHHHHEMPFGVGEGLSGGGGGGMMDSGSAPQLVMPSIKMPSRRPFTAPGKSLGRLKVLIAGDTGVGKTSLVKAIVQSCEHIVHVDPIAPPQMSASSVARAAAAAAAAGGARSSPRGRRQQQQAGSTRLNADAGGSGAGTRHISEIYASTKPYPEWWSEMDIDDDSRVPMRRRKSMGDAVLDRNICFVDTPGYGSGSSSMETITPVVQYVESHLQRISANALAEGDTLNMLGGDGGVQVDAVLYLVLNRLRPVDIHYLRQLSPLTNIILLLAQADLMSAGQIAASREQIQSQLLEARIRPFSFATISTNPDAAPQNLFAISSATGSDHDTMDASLLMSPDYVQPLIPTELAALVGHIFSQGGAARLRHSAARKYLQWRKAESAFQPLALYQQPQQQSQLMTSSYAQSSSYYHHNHHNHHNHHHHNHRDSQVLTPPFGATSSYAVARVTDHAQREERLAQIRLVNWAADLQRSLANERAQYEGLARSERAIWLTEKLSECVQDGMLVPAAGRGRSSSGSSGSGSSSTPARRASRRKTAADGRASAQHMQHHDPLGLLQVAADLRHKGLIVLEVFGGLGVLGGLALFLTRQYGHLQTYDWLITEWDKLWYGGGR